MKLTKENVCVFIESEAHLEEARQLLEKYGEIISDDGTFSISEDYFFNYLRVFIDETWFLGTVPERKNVKQITLTELEQILIEERK